MALVTADTLLAEVYARPDEDAPRLVYADWLIERGDPRGELIVLQCAPTTFAGAQRAVSLIAKHGKMWLGPLAPVLTGLFEFRRGFVAVAKARFKTEAAYANHRDHAAWATVEELAFSVPHVRRDDHWRSGVSAAMRGLRVLTGHAGAIVDAGAPLPIERLVARFADRDVLHRLVRAKLLPKLAVLEIEDTYCVPGWFDGVAALPLAELRVPAGDLEGWRAQAQRLGVANLVIGRKAIDLARPAKAKPKRRAVALETPLAARVTPEGCWIGEEERLVLVDPASGAPLREIATNHSYALALARDRAVRTGERSEIIALATGKATKLGLSLNAPGTSVSDDGRVVAVSNGNVCIAWDIATDRKLWEKPAVANHVAVSRDGARVAYAANPPPGITVRPAVKGGRATQLGDLEVTGLCWLPDGTLASAHGDAGVFHWDAAGKARQISKLAGHTLVAGEGRVALGVGGIVHAIEVATGASTRLGAATVWAFAGARVVLVGDSIRLV